MLHPNRITGALLILASVCGLAAGASPSETSIQVNWGDHPFPGPVYWDSQGWAKPNLAYSMTDGQGRTVAAQSDAEGRIWWWAPAGSPVTETYVIKLPGIDRNLAGVSAPKPRVIVEKKGESRIDVRIDGKLFTTFNYGEADTKPYLYPVIGPTGDPVTRDWPMKDVEAEKAAKRQDHPHHRSFWTAHGDVRTGDQSKKGTDYWASDEIKEQDGRRVPVHRGNSGLQKVTKVRTQSGPVFGEIVAEVDWLTADGRRELSDTRTYRFFRGGGDIQVLDYRVVFHFPDGDVMFADTKEGGIISVRVATTMDETAKKGGHMVNSRGQKGMKECWGQPAEWCDYVGPVAGGIVGIAVFDSPANFRHPTRWHIRDYGLYTANPFLLRDATKSGDASHTWKKGESAEFNYRVVIHKGETEEAKVAAQYQHYARPPRVTVATSK